MTKFKIGDRVRWIGIDPIEGTIVKRARLNFFMRPGYNKNCWILDKKGYNSCHESHLELI